MLVIVVVLAGLSLSCGKSSYTATAASQNAYVTLPASGSVLQLHINGATGTITMGAQTPVTENTSPTGLALLPSKKFLYAINSRANTISIFNVASDGTLTLSGAPVPAGGSSPNAAVIDPTGSYLLVTNNLTDDVSVFSIDAGSGALTPVAGSPFPAHTNPTEILITPSGKFVYVTNPNIGAITAFAFSSSDGTLTPLPGSPFSSLAGGGGGAFGLAVDGSERFLYVTNPSASNPPPNVSTVGNISGFNIDPNTGALTPILGSPFTATNGIGPSAITVDPAGKFVYATTTGSSSSIWCFAITPTTGQLVAVTNSPFSLAAGGLFALIDPKGNFLYIGTQVGNGISGYTYSASTGAPTVIVGSPFSTGKAPGKMVLSQ
ncbi:MAG: lactonase family protein [Acidobacteriia bacterium]|nr:lactonase family protein [Terriglobia bacterium]